MDSTLVLKYYECYNVGREVTFSIQVAIIATSNTPLNIIIYLENSNVFGATYCPHQDLYTNIYSIKTFVKQKHKKHKNNLKIVLIKNSKAVAILPSTAIYPQRLFCRELFVIGQS